MSVVQDMTFVAEQAGRRYLALVEAWRGIYAVTMTGDDFMSPRGLSQVRDRAYDHARNFIEYERREIDDVLGKLVERAVSDVLGSDARATAETRSDRVSELQNAISTHLDSEIVVQIERDIAFLLRRVRGAALEVDMMARLHSVPLRTAAIQRRVATGPALAFYVNDRANRRWPSERFIRATWRQAQLDVYNLTILSELADMGVDHAIVRLPGSKHDGQRVAVVPGGRHPTYAELRDEIFHPNSEALLSRPEEA